ncbi:MAG: hypothetical protein GEU73_01020 [Chloroflexi bacterium]|nr:hypothetical protein [Chloroflexota bacterium]
MIRGYIRADSTRRRPFVEARLTIPSQRIAGDVPFLVDTGADAMLLAPTNALFLRMDLDRLPPGPPTTGVGGMTPTVLAGATLTVGAHTFDLTLRILAPATAAQRSALARMPSLLGRDILSHFALFFEERTDRVLLLTPEEANLLNLPR